MRNILCIALLLTSLPVVANAAEAAALVKAATLAEPQVKWLQRSVLQADLTCRGRKEYAVLGTRGSALKLAIFIDGANKQPVFLEIDSGLRASITTMTPEAQDFDVGTKEPGDPGPLPGFKRSTTCKGLKLDDNRIDSVHVYWNRVEQRFQTWQR